MKIENGKVYTTTENEWFYVKGHVDFAKFAKMVVYESEEFYEYGIYGHPIELETEDDVRERRIREITEDAEHLYLLHSTPPEGFHDGEYDVSVSDVPKKGFFKATRINMVR